MPDQGVMGGRGSRLWAREVVLGLEFDERVIEVILGLY